MDYEALKRKFPSKRAKDGTKDPMHRRSTKAAVKAIAREYEMKKAELRGAGAPNLKRGPVFYLLIVVGLMILGWMVLSASKNGIGFGRRRIERKDLMARKAMDALTVALGRYKFHVGSYPTAEEGLAVLAYRRPNEIRGIRRRHPGWDGPYVNHVVKDPWGNDYFYEPRPEGGHPVLYSKGPNGRAGDDDDVLPEQTSFDAPFEDASWTNRWAPCELRGVVVAPDAETKRRVEEQMGQYE